MTHLLASGAPVGVVQRLAGHASLAMTARYQSALADAARSATAGLYADALGPAAVTRRARDHAARLGPAPALGSPAFETWRAALDALGDDAAPTARAVLAAMPDYGAVLDLAAVLGVEPPAPQFRRADVSSLF